MREPIDKLVDEVRSASPPGNDANDSAHQDNNPRRQLLQPLENTATARGSIAARRNMPLPGTNPAAFDNGRPLVKRPRCSCLAMGRQEDSTRITGMPKPRPQKIRGRVTGLTRPRTELRELR
jgi:hypothetical protein